MLPLIVLLTALGVSADEDGSAMGEPIRHTEGLVAASRELRERLQRDPQRPVYHLTAPAGWMNDINGPLFYKGRYHVFYQHNPDGAFWNWMQWGHASSVDLVHWVHHPIALTPTPGGPDRDGCFSGAAVVHDGVPTLVYHGVPEGTCLATSSDPLLVDWVKEPANPVVRVPQPGDGEYGRYQVYDPCAWRAGEDWYLLCGGRLPAGGDTAYLFRSQDLRRWEYLRPFYQPRPDWTDPYEDCAVPTFLPFGDRALLLFVSHKYGAQYYIGRQGHEEFIPETHGRMNWAGGQFVAPIGMFDGRGRCLLLGWVCEARRNTRVRAGGWAGVMTLPRVLTLSDDGGLGIEPAPELEVLRYGEERVGPLPLRPGEDRALAGIEGDCLEIDAEIEVGDAETVGLVVRRSPDGAEETRIAYSSATQSLSIDTRKTAEDGGMVRPWPCPWGVMYDNPLETRVLHYHDAAVRIEDVPVQSAPLALEPGERLRLRVFLDRSILEVFANGRQCMTQRIYPSRSDSLGVAAFTAGGSARLARLHAWRMAPAGI